MLLFSRTESLGELGLRQYGSNTSDLFLGIFFGVLYEKTTSPATSILHYQQDATPLLGTFLLDRQLERTLKECLKMFSAVVSAELSETLTELEDKGTPAV